MTIHDVTPDRILSSVSLSEPGRAFLAGEPAAMEPVGDRTGAREIVVDPDDRDQPLLGLGSIVTGTDLAALGRLPPDVFDAALRALFDPGTGAGWSLMRVPFGSTDWERTPDFFTYDDAPDGERDWTLARFSVARDRDRGLFALLRRAREINPALRFHGAVWGIPAWMKENRLRFFGRFDPACAEVYARYLARTVLALRGEGVPLVAVSPQNESLTANDRPTPAACMPWWVQRDVVVAMRREFDRAGLGDVAVWAFDHNYDLSDFFVRPLLADPAARAAIGGVAFHDYGGEPEPAMGALHRERPDLPLYATERTVLGPDGMARIVRQLRAGARCYNQWTTASDEWGGPHLFQGHPFRRGAEPPPPDARNFLVVPRDDPSSFELSPAWGLYGQFTRHLRPGMVRVACTGGSDGWLRAVAFRDPATGEIAVVTVNATRREQAFALRCGGAAARLAQAARSVASWRFVPGALCRAARLAVPPEADAAAPALPWDLGGSEAPAAAAATGASWRLAVDDIRLGGPAVAGAELPLSCVVRNAGDAPVPPDATLRVDFKLDGDLPVALAILPLPPLAPGEAFEVRANVPVGLPYHDRPTWIAEAGHHQIFAMFATGNVRAGHPGADGVFAREFDFSAAPADV